MRRIIVGLVLLISLEVSAKNETHWVESMVLSGLKIGSGYALASWFPSADDAKFTIYFSAGEEYPCIICPVVAATGVYVHDSIAVSVAFSLANRCIALTGLHEKLNLAKDQAYMWVVVIDQGLGKVPGLEKFPKPNGWVLWAIC
ncbi:MAG: hypothetical protein WCK49_08990 [Myxococcaceae bacterium]